MGLFLGLDIGISYVGYGIVNDDGEAVDAGVRLFAEGTSKDNADRRNRRHGRRLLRRRQHRLLRADRLFVASGLAVYDEKGNIDLHCDKETTPYHLRAKGLREVLSNKELVIALRHLLKHRGSAPLNAYSENEDSSNAKKDASTKSLIAKTKARLDAGAFVCELQLERLDNPEIAHVRGVENRFLSEDYAREARQILETQKKLNPLVSEDFCQTYMTLLETRRAYFEGPGQESPFSWANTEEWMERLMGNCVYTGETRIVKAAPSAEMFNLLNDLNNMRINGAHISKEEKHFLVESLFCQQVAMPSVDKVLKLLGRKKDSVVTGLRVSTKNEKQLFTELKSWHYIRKARDAAGSSFDMKDFDTADEIARILTIYKDKETASKQLFTLGLDDNFIEALVGIYDKTSGNIFKGTHSLSRKAIWSILEDLWQTSMNQMELFSEKGMRPLHGSHFIQNGRVIPEIVGDMAVSAVARRSISQAFTVFNDLMEKYPKGFTKVTVKMAREKNSDERKKFLNELQKSNEKLNSQVREVLENHSCDGRLFEKVRLWLLQDKMDIYTGEEIPLDDLITKSWAYEVDYIVPISVSFDSSMSNKALTSTLNNQAKGQMTPYQWMQNPDAPDFTAFKGRVMAVKNKQQMPKKKRYHLLLQDDVNRWKTRKEFIRRNLVDTRYATKEVMFALKACLHSHCTYVRTVNGSFVQYLKKLWGLNQEQSGAYSNYAVDALITAASSLVIDQLNIVKNYDVFDDSDGDAIVVDRKTGEVIDDADNLKDAIFQFKRYGRNFSSFDRIRYSHKVDKKKNRGLGNDTLYSTRVRPSDNREWKIRKIKNLYDEKVPMKLLGEFFESEPEKLLLHESDFPSYMKLKDVYDTYKGDGQVNPFYRYFNEHGYVFKNSPNGNGPAIKSVKFYDSPVGDNPFDLTHKYSCKPGKRVIKEGVSTYRVDVYKSTKGYKIVRVSVSMSSGTDAGNLQLEREKLKQKISHDDLLLFSLYPGDLFRLNGELYRFCGYSAGYQITMQPADRLNLDDAGKTKPLSQNIGPRTISVEKVCCGSLGIIC